MVSQDTGRYPDTVWYPDTIWYPDTGWYPDIGRYPDTGLYPDTVGYPYTVGYPPETDIRQYPDAAVAWRTDTDIRNRTGYPVFADTVESSSLY